MSTAPPPPSRDFTRTAWPTGVRAGRRVLNRLNEEVAARRHRSAHELYDRFHEFTMVPEPWFVDNLRLVDTLGPVPGDIVECGTWRGGMVAAIATRLADPARHVHLFDSFEGLPPAGPADGESAHAWQADPTGPDYHDNCRAEQAEAEAAMRRSGAAAWTIHRGWFDDTVGPFAQSEPTPRVALLRLDGDWYDSTLTCLRALYPLVVPGGLVIIDDYDVWDGCSRAVHDYLSETSSPDRINHFGSVPYLRRR